MERLLGLEQGGWVASKVLGSIALEEGRYEAAVRHFRLLKKARSLDPASYRGLAGVYLAQKAYDEALPELLELARTSEGDADVAATIGMIYARRGGWFSARYWYTQALYVDPYRAENHRKLADVCMRLGDTRMAIREYESLCILEPDNVEHFEQAAVAHHKIGDAVAARRFARQAVALDPDTSVRTLIKDQ